MIGIEEDQLRVVKLWTEKARKVLILLAVILSKKASAISCRRFFKSSGGLNESIFCNRFRYLAREKQDNSKTDKRCD